jgi:hypothetical protein
VTLPSKKNIPIIIACLIAGGGIIFAAIYSGTSAPKTGTLTVVKNDTESNTPTNLITTTSDDWKKQFSAAHMYTSSSTLATQSTKVATNTLTNQVAQTLFTNYLNLKNSGKTITTDMQNQIVEQTLSNTNFGTTQAPVYTQYNITITQDISNAALRTYANAMGAIFRKNSAHSQTNEMAIVTAAVNTQNQGEQQKDLLALDPIIASYKAMIKDMLKVPVPSPLIASHINLLNSFSQGLDADMKMRNLYGDAAGALEGLKEYEVASVQIVTSLQNIAGYYQSQSIEFNQNEDGYGFINLGSSQ